MEGRTITRNILFTDSSADNFHWIIIIDLILLAAQTITRLCASRDPTTLNFNIKVDTHYTFSVYLQNKTKNLVNLIKCLLEARVGLFSEVDGDDVRLAAE